MSDPPARRRVVEATARRPPAELQTIRVVVVEDDDPDVSFMKSPELADRMAAYKRGELGFVAVRAEADVMIEGVAQMLTSTGCWSVEGDSSEEELYGVANAEWDQLRKVLKTIGVPTARLPNDLDPKWIEWRT